MSQESQHKLSSVQSEVEHNNAPQGLQLPSSLTTRIMSGTVFVLVILLACYLGSWFLSLLLGLVAAGAAYEAAEIARLDGKIVRLPLIMSFAFIFPIAAHFGSSYTLVVSLVLFMVVACWYLCDAHSNFAELSLSLFIPIYTGLLLAVLVLINRSAAVLPGLSFYLTATIFVSVWANDSCAYLCGSLFGKHKMVPTISPKKSWEGFIAGLLASMLIWLALSFALPQLGIGWPLACALGFFCGITGFIGDLFESRMKRAVQIKDSGKFLPGHGGVLDRFDSLFLVSITAYILLKLAGVII